MELIDRNEVQEPRVTEAPKCWPHKQSYWSCFGTYPEPKKQPWWSRKKDDPEEKTWILLAYTKEDAEAQAVICETGWVWDKEPARMVSLSDSMFRARQKGRLGVMVESFVNGKWVTVRKYKATEPLPEE